MIRIKTLSEKEYANFLNTQKKVNFLQSVEEYRKLQCDNQNTEIIGFVDDDVLYGAWILVYTRYAKLFYKCCQEPPPESIDSDEACVLGFRAYGTICVTAMLA